MTQDHPHAGHDNYFVLMHTGNIMGKHMKAWTADSGSGCCWDAAQFCPTFCPLATS